MPFLRQHWRDSPEVIDLLDNLKSDIYNSSEVNDWLNEEVKISNDDNETEEDVLRLNHLSKTKLN